MVVDDIPRNLSERGKDTNGEWENVRSLLTYMGLQLITAPNNIVLSGNSSKNRRKKGIRELHNLEFKVNYDRSDCSRGKSLCP